MGDIKASAYVLGYLYAKQQGIIESQLALDRAVWGADRDELRVDLPLVTDGMDTVHHLSELIKNLREDSRGA